MTIDRTRSGDAFSPAIVAEADPEAPADILTTVVRIPGELGQRMASVAMSLGMHEPSHYCYPAESLHFTVLSLGRTGSTLPPEGAVRRFIDALAGSPAPDVTLRGVRVGPRTVYVRAVSADRSVEHLSSLAAPAVFGVEGPSTLDGDQDRARVPHVNIVRFRDPPGRSMRDAVLEVHDTDFGTFRPTEDPGRHVQQGHGPVIDDGHRTRGPQPWRLPAAATRLIAAPVPRW